LCKLQEGLDKRAEGEKEVTPSDLTNDVPLLLGSIAFEIKWNFNHIRTNARREKQTLDFSAVKNGGINSV
jgi:hypothetical protein